MTVREVRDHLGKRVDAAHYGGEATVVTTNGEPRAVLVPYSWWDALEKPPTTTDGQQP